MNNVLIIELYTTTLRVCLFDQFSNSFSELDITGGYGKKAIPLFLHYVEDETKPLIGEDALLYDEEEKSFIKYMLKDEQSFLAYFEVLIHKLSDQYTLTQGDRIVLIYSEEQCFEHLKSISKLLGHTTLWLGIKECLGSCGSIAETKDSDEFLILTFDEVLVYQVFVQGNTTKTSVSEFPMTEMDDFYMEMIKSHHEEAINEYKILKLYEAQKGLIQQQLLTQKNVNVYSSLQYPPKKITLDFKLSYQFLIQWEKAFSVPFLQQISKMPFKVIYIATTYFDHPLIRTVFGKKSHRFITIDFLLPKGAIALLQESVNKFKTRSLESFDNAYHIRTNDLDVEIISKGQEFTQKIEIELVLTDFQNVIELHQIGIENSLKSELHIKSDKNIQLIQYIMLFDERQNLCEVYYELRSK